MGNFILNQNRPSNTSFTTSRRGLAGKVLLLLALQLLLLFPAMAQVVTVGTGNDPLPQFNRTENKPYGSFFGYERSADIYLNSEIGMSGTINSLGFFLNSVNSPAASTPVVIFMKQTTNAVFSSNTTVPDEESGATQVFSGNITSGQLSPNNWVTVALNTPFVYSNSSNLEIIIETNGGNINSGFGLENNSNSKVFRFTFLGTGVNRLQIWNQDGIPPGSSTRGVLQEFRPNVQLTFGSQPQTCDAPTGLTATNITSATATLDFTASSTGATGTYTVQFGLAGFTNGTGTTVSGPPFNVIGLSPSTTYDFTVQKNCGANGTSSFVRSQFTTNAAAATCAAPTSISATSTTATTTNINFSGGDVGTSYILEYGPSSTFPIGTTLASMSGSPFALTNLSPSTAYSFVVRTNCSNGVTSGNSPTGTFTTSIAPQTCTEPSNLNATNVTNTTAQLNFTQSAGLTGSYTLEYGLNGFSPGAGNGTVVSNLTGNSFNATGLSPSTAYQFYVFKDCGINGTSSFAGPASFTTTATPATCDAPINLSATNITNTTASLNFTPTSTGAAGTYVIEYGISGFQPGNGTSITGLTASPFTLTGLTANTTYDFYVKKNCGGTGFSTNTGPSNFTTLQSPPPCVTGTWTGTVSTDWNNAANWCNSQLPGSTTDVIIPSGTPFAPIITSNSSTRNLTIIVGATLSLNAATLTVNGLLTTTGTFENNGNGSLVFTSSDLQTLGKVTQTNFLDLTVGPGGAILSGPVGVKHLLNLNGNLSTNNQNFTLLAEPANQAMVINNNGVVNGTTKVQRYINPGLNPSLGYRHLAAPVSNTTISDLNDPGVNLVINPAYNSSSTPSTVRPFPTIFSYDETRLTNATATSSAFTFGWKSPNSANDPMTPGQAYTVNMPPVIVDFNGTLNNGNISVGPLTRGSTTNSGWHLLGNPYPSPIDWDLVSVPAGIDNAVYVFRSNSQYGGSYVSYVNGIGPPNSDLIATAQGFFVRVSSGSPTFTFTNSMRVNTYENPAFYRQTQTGTRPMLSLALQNTAGLQDELFIYFETGATSNFDVAFDAYKLPNSGSMPTLYSLANTEALSINGLPLPTTTTTIPLGAWVNAAGTYTILTSQLMNFGSAPVYLEDRTTGTVIDLQQQKTYLFNTNQTDLNGRFFLRFSPATTTSITETSLSAQTLVYPNPGNGNFTISMPLQSTEPVSVKIYNTIGQEILQKTFKPSTLHLQETVNLNRVPAGIYTLRLESTTGIVVKKLVVE